MHGDEQLASTPPDTEQVFVTVQYEGETPYVRVLADQLRSHHPGARLFSIYVAHDGAPPRDGNNVPGVVPISMADLGLSPERAAALWLTAPREALRPALAAAALPDLMQGSERVVFLAPDTAVYAPLPESSRHPVEIVARFEQLPASDAQTPTPADLCQLSLYDPGFFICDRTGADALDRLRTTVLGSEILDPGEWGRLWDTVGADGRVGPPTDRSIGLAWWNIHERCSSRELSGGPHPTTARFPGLDANRPYLLSADQGSRPRVLLSEHPVVAEMVLAQAASLLANGWSPGADTSRVGGLEIGEAIRAAARRALRRGDDTLPPTTTAGELREWLIAPEPGTRNEYVTRYVAGLWESNEFARNSFPNPLDDHSEALVNWVRQMSVQLRIPHPLVPLMPSTDRAEVTGEEEDLRPGINLVGFLRAGFGIGEATRLFASALDAGEVPHSTISLSHDDLDDLVGDAGEAELPIYDTNLICVNVDWLDVVSRRLGPSFLSSRYAIGTWWWESNVLPQHLVEKIPLFDEIWVGSNFIADSLAAYTDRPIRIFPLPIPVPEPQPAPNRSELGLPSGYMFMFSFDFNSTVERKNPDGVIDAFCRAFAPNEGPILVLKTINGHRHLDELERLRALTAHRGDIVVFDGFLPPDQRDAWARACDCYVSLHRCEGFGLTMAEAMALGKPVIATRFSANLDFMDDDTAFLVDFEPWELSRPSGPYPAGTIWAQPDTEQAAQYMREVWADPDAARHVGQRAQDVILATRTPERLAEFVNTRLEEIRMAGVDEPKHSEHPPALNDVIAYDQQRGQAGQGFAGRVVGRAIQPYAAGADALTARLLGALVEASGRIRSLEVRADSLERHEHSSADRLRRMDTTIANLARDLVVVADTTGDAARLAGDAARLAQGLDAQLHPDLYMAHPDDLIQYVDGVAVHLAYDSAPGALATAAAYADFEDVFRGPPERVQANLAPYVPLLQDHQPVLDVGAGRGEMLEMLAATGVTARGVDLDAGMVARATAQGLDVVEADGVEYLRAQPPNSLGAIFAAHVIEHMPWPTLQAFLAASHAALSPGGVLICETVNPHCLRALKAFWLDPTHQHPLFPEACLVYARQAGFPSASIRFTSATGTLERDRRESDSFALIAYA